VATKLSRTGAARTAAAALASIIIAFAAITYLSYTAAFTSTDSVTVMSPRAGLVMEKDAKVKYRGIQIGKVKDIAYSGDQAKLTLAIDSHQMRYIPSNADVRIASNTIFGAKSVEFVPPGKPSGKSLRPGRRWPCRRCRSRSTRCSRGWSTCCTRSTRSI
jgi:phospholipid/cholesterol/gamma-HCH transport system substrate-binding protein